MGGEKARPMWHWSYSGIGSPPRGRGKVTCRRRPTGSYKDHPRVGGEKSVQMLGSSSGAWDHPRVGGEKRRFSRQQYPHDRDHPRVGGEKCRSMNTLGTDHRITPAWAGKSSCRFILGQLATGSPPRGRGKDLPFINQGKRLKDHPRMGGEKGFRSSTTKAR